MRFIEEGLVNIAECVLIRYQRILGENKRSEKVKSVENQFAVF